MTRSDTTTRDWPAWYDGPRDAKQAKRLDAFIAWIDVHPSALERFIAGARALTKRDERLTPWRIWEHVRSPATASDDAFRLRNDYLPLMSRLAMHHAADLAGRIPVRPLGRHGGQVRGAGLGIDLDLAAEERIAWHEREIARLKGEHTGGDAR